MNPNNGCLKNLPNVAQILFWSKICQKGTISLKFLDRHLHNWNKLQLDGLLYLSTDLTYLTIVYKRDKNTSEESKSTYLLSGGFCLSDALNQGN